MNKENKHLVVAELTEKFNQNRNFYLVDSSGMSVGQVNNLRRKCFAEGIELTMVKNSLIEKALLAAGINEDMSAVLKGPSSIMFSESNTAPAKLIKEFRKTTPKPQLKGAFIEDSLYVGDDQLDNLLRIKSKQQLIGEVLGMLQSPMQNVISGLTGQGSKIAGILKTLAEKEA